MVPQGTNPDFASLHPGYAFSYSPCQTAQCSSSPAHLASGFFSFLFTFVAADPERGDWRSADPPPEPSHVASGCLRLLQRLTFLRLRRSHAASSILRVNHFEPG